MSHDTIVHRPWPVLWAQIFVAARGADPARARAISRWNAKQPPPAPTLAPAASQARAHTCPPSVTRQGLVAGRLFVQLCELVDGCGAATNTRGIPVHDRVAKAQRAVSSQDRGGGAARVHSRSPSHSRSLRCEAARRRPAAAAAGRFDAPRDAPHSHPPLLGRVSSNLLLLCVVRGPLGAGRGPAEDHLVKQSRWTPGGIRHNTTKPSSNTNSRCSDSLDRFGALDETGFRRARGRDAPRRLG